MAENASKARTQIEGHRKQVRGSIEKFKNYKEDYEKREQVDTITRVQGLIQKLKDVHPSLRNGTQSEDTWRP